MASRCWSLKRQPGSCSRSRSCGRRNGCLGKVGAPCCCFEHAGTFVRQEPEAVGGVDGKEREPEVEGDAGEGSKPNGKRKLSL